MYPDQRERHRTGKVFRGPVRLLPSEQYTPNPAEPESKSKHRGFPDRESTDDVAGVSVEAKEGR